MLVLWFRNNIWKENIKKGKIVEVNHGFISIILTSFITMKLQRSAFLFNLVQLRRLGWSTGSKKGSTFPYGKGGNFEVKV